MAYPSKTPRICRVTANSGKMKVTGNSILQEGYAMKDELDFAGLDLQERFGASARPIVRVDVEKYQALLDGVDMTDAQKEEFLQALWSIIVSFVRLGFGVHPLQKVCGKTAKIGSQGAKDAFDAVSSGEPEKGDNTKGFSP